MSSWFVTKVTILTETFNHDCLHAVRGNRHTHWFEVQYLMCHLLSLTSSSYYSLHCGLDSSLFRFTSHFLLSRFPPLIATQVTRSRLRELRVIHSPKFSFRIWDCVRFVLVLHSQSESVLLDRGSWMFTLFSIIVASRKNTWDNAVYGWYWYWNWSGCANILAIHY